MSDDQKNGDGKIAHLINKARNRSKDAEQPNGNMETPDTDLELQIDDPTREQQTPPELNDDITPEQELELDEEEEAKGGLLSRMSLKQRVLLVGLVAAVIVAAVIVGANSTLSSDKGLDYLDQGQQAASSGPAQTSAGPSPTTTNGFEPIDQGGIAPDPNALNFTGDTTSPEAVTSTAFSVDPLDEETDETETSPDPIDAPDAQVEEMGEGEAVGDDVVPVVASVDSVTFDESPFSAQQSEDSGPADEDLLPPQGFGAPTSSTSAEIQQVRAEIGSLNSEISSLSQSVLSIKQEMTDTASANRQLVNEVSRLMAALEERDEQVRDLKSRPDIRDLVIFRAASSCDTCIPHAFFKWNDKEIEVGDGLQWKGYDVAIRGDRMTLRNEQNVYHYWYR